MPICHDNDDCYGCRLRAKGVAVAASATPNRTANRPYVHRPMQDPSWEKGIAGERRPGGAFMPYLGADGQPMGVKEAADNRGGVETQIKRLKSDPHVFAAERAASTKE
jgi:hypothetical protein